MTSIWPNWNAKKVKYYFSNPSLKKSGPRKVTAAATLDVKKIEEDDSLISQVIHSPFSPGNFIMTQVDSIQKWINVWRKKYLRNDYQIWSGLKTRMKKEWGSNLVKLKIIMKLPMVSPLNILGKSALPPTITTSYCPRNMTKPTRKVDGKIISVIQIMIILNLLRIFPEIIIMQALPLSSVILVLPIFIAKDLIPPFAQEQRYDSD